jgi:hypothetical protein
MGSKNISAHAARNVSRRAGLALRQPAPASFKELVGKGYMGSLPRDPLSQARKAPLTATKMLRLRQGHLTIPANHK